MFVKVAITGLTYEFELSTRIVLYKVVEFPHPFQIVADTW